MDENLRKLERLAKNGDRDAIARLHRAKLRMYGPKPGPTKKERQEERRQTNLEEAERRRAAKPSPLQSSKKSFVERVLTKEELDKYKEKNCWKCKNKLLPVSRRCLHCERRNKA